MKRNDKNFNLNDFLLTLLSKGRYCFTLNEIRHISKLSDKAIHQALYRAKKNNKIAQIRQEFYVIIPPEFYDRKMIPPYLFIDDMMNFLNKTYYVSLFSAASMFGAGHQQPMLFQLIIETPSLRNIKRGNLEIHYFVKKQIDINYIVKRKTKTGYINISSVELTILDLILYHHRIGGIGRILSVLEELLEDADVKKIYEIAIKHNLKTVLQRLGFISDVLLGYQEISNFIYKHLNKTKKIPFSLLHPAKGKLDKKWKIIVNTEVEI